MNSQSMAAGGGAESPRTSFYKYASPQTFYPLAGRLAPWFAAAAAVLGAIGLYIAFS